MSDQLVIINVTARGLDKSYNNAFERAADRLETAARALRQGRLPNDPAVTHWINDPGGGGGPCAAEYVDLPVPVTPSGLPEARRRDDD